jgi:hypothetical protein
MECVVFPLPVSVSIEVYITKNIYKMIFGQLKQAFFPGMSCVGGGDGKRIIGQTSGS